MVDYHQIVFVRKSSNTNQSTTTNIPIGYYTSCPTTDDDDDDDDDDDAINNTNIESHSMTSQTIEFQYNITWLVVTNTTIDTNSSTIATTTDHFIDSIRFTMETTLHEYLVPELLSTCRTDQAEDDEVDVQFYSVSTLPIDIQSNSPVGGSPSSCTTTATSSNPCVMTIHAAITLETFYSNNIPIRQRQRQNQERPLRDLDESSTFSDPILLERIGSSLVSFFKNKNAIPNATFMDANQDLYPFYDWNVTFWAITNFVPEDQPYTDTVTIDTNDDTRNNNNSTDATVSGIAIDQNSTNQPATIDKSMGIVVMTMAITAFLITIMMIVFRKKEKKEKSSNHSWWFRRRRRRRQEKDDNMESAGEQDGTTNHNDTTFSLELENDECAASFPPVNESHANIKNNNSMKKDDDDDVSFIVNDIMEQDSQAEMIGPCRDWELYHTTNDTPPMFVPSFDDDILVVVRTANDDNNDGQDHRWI